MIVSKGYELSAGMVYFYLVNISLFYIQMGILEKYIGRQAPDYVTSGFFMAVMLVTNMILKIIGELIIDNGKKQNFIQHPENFQTMFTLDLLRSIFYLVLGTTYWMIIYNNRLRKDASDKQIRQLTLANINADLRIKLSNAQNAYLQQQISPHLLFNTLNFVYSTVHKHSPAGGHAVYLLTEILDFSLSKSDENGRIVLNTEIEQVRNLIALNRFRFDFELPLELVVNGDPSAHRIIPLVLLTLVENMFVHGDFTGKAAGIIITISANGTLEFETKNAISSRSSSPGKGTGLNNIRTRLEHSYPGGFQMSAEEAGHHFFTKLTIQL